MKTFLLSLTGALALAMSPGIAKAGDDFSEGMDVGGVIATCLYLEGDEFQNPKFGRGMLASLYDDLSVSNQRMVVQVFQSKGLSSCSAAVR